METGKEIVDNWYEESKKTSFRYTDLEKRIDEALQTARTEGEIAGAERMVELVMRTMVVS